MLLSINQTTLKDLINLTKQRRTDEIKSRIENLPSTVKGKVFTLYMTELFRGNGWLAEYKDSKGDKGADILLANPKNPDSILFVVQCKNQRRPLTCDDTIIELEKFGNKARNHYKCDQFRLCAVNGYVDDATKLRAFNLRLDHWFHVAELIEKYDPESITEPEIELYSHNQQTYERIEQLWEHENRVAVVQPTGTGKTFHIAKVIARVTGCRSLILAPSNAILVQLKEVIRWCGETVQFMTYTKAMLLTGEDIQHLSPQLIVLDEFHRCGATEWGLGVTRILDCFPNARVLGTSATPVRFLDGGRNMADELFAGHTAQNMSLAQAIQRRIVPAPTYVCAIYTLQEEMVTLVDRVQRTTMSEADRIAIRRRIGDAAIDWEKTSGIPNILRKYAKGELLKFIVFCIDMTHLDSMEETVRGWFQKALKKKRESYRVVSDDQKAAKELERFRGANDKSRVHLLFCIDMLNEGIHVDDISGVVLLRPTESPIIFYQQIGRSIQAGSPNSPLIFDFVNNFKSIRATDFKRELQSAGQEEQTRREACGLTCNLPQILIHDETRNAIELLSEIAEQLSPKANAIRKTEAFCDRYKTLDNLPAQNSQDTQARNDAAWLNQKRQAKKQGSTKHAFYPEMDSIASSHGMRGLFDCIDRKLQAVNRTHKLCKRQLTGPNLPKMENWLKNARVCKQRYVSGTRDAGYWPEMDDVANSYGLAGIFDTFDYKQIAIARLRDVCVRIAARGTRPQSSRGSDELEHQDARIISGLRRAKYGKGKYVFHAEMENILREYGLEDLLDSLEDRMVKQTIEFCNRYRDGKLPTAQENDPNKKDGEWLAAKRRVKAGTATGRWYARMDEIASEFGLNGLFDFEVITEDRARDWLWRFYERETTYPTARGGPVLEAVEDGFGYRKTAWAAIHRRHLLEKLIDAVRPRFSCELVKKWNDVEISEGRKPITKNGEHAILSAQRDGYPLNGASINHRLIRDCDVSLAKLLRSREQAAFSIELAARWLQLEKDRTGKWPSVLTECIVAAVDDGYEKMTGNALNKKLKLLGTTISNVKNNIKK